jgi:hypothetical protein
MRTSVRHRFVQGRGGRLVRPIGWAAAAALLALSVLSPAGVGAANPPSPTYGTAVVDGSINEWSLSGDVFADMTEDGYANKPVVAHLYLRYDCDSTTLFALVLGNDGVQFRQTRPENAYVRIDGSGKLFSGNSGNNGTPPDFAWVNGNGTLADGYEGSGKLDPGSYTIRAHALQPDNSADGYKEIDNIGRSAPLVIECAKPTPTPTASVEASVEASAASHDPGGSVLDVTSKPRVTLPPTSTLGAGDPPTTSLGLVFLGLGLVIGGAMVLLEKPKLARGRRRR